ncbi:MAG: DUF5703 domain-containing protein [Verrucomicrobia bacterium]|nr:DUF5703 domain-containing protein [Verrucomicrobiota bacterium]
MKTLGRLIFTSLLSTALLAISAVADEPAWRAALERCDVTWLEPSKDSRGSMPLGNGDIGLNVWVESGGDLLFYLSKTDAWSENAQLLKLGRVRVHLSPNPFQPGRPFQQQLHLATGEIVVTAGTGPQAITLRVWVDANHPVALVDMEGKSPFEVQADLEAWRTSQRELKGQDRNSVYGLHDSPTPVFSEPDKVMEGGGDQVVWYHRNERSIWGDNLRLQALGELTRTMPDPLLHRTFGGTLRGEGLTRVTPTSLKSVKPQHRCRLTVSALTRQTETPKEWLEQMEAVTKRSIKISSQRRLSAHRRWWNEFWGRSYIFVSGDAEAERVTQGYTLQRFINACAGRGALPIKFNGTIFTTDGSYQGQRFDPDFRMWGGPYWFQNTRLPYWSMLASGDFDCMQPLFRMYTDSLPLAQYRARRYYGHGGAFWPETQYFWGTYTDDNYGRDRKGKPDGLTDNRYIRYYWQGGLELVMMMLDYYEFTRDEKFARTTLLPIAVEATTFFDEHWPRDSRGKIRFDPAMSLETFHVAVNPAPEIAALRAVLPRLLALPSGQTTAVQRARWSRTLADLPDLPLAEREGGKVLSPAEQFSNKANIENPELYSIFPYRLYSLGRPDLDVALRSFEKRIYKDSGGWQQDAIQAALLGLGDDAARMVAGNFSRKNPESRFPAFWGPNFDWTPDQDHGCVPMIALQKMLLQSDEGKLRLLPAWPKRWNVHFKLQAPERTTVEADFRDGKVQWCEVIPARRAKDLVSAPSPK